MAQYIITDGTKYIMKGKRGNFTPTNCAAWAEIFSKEKATNVLNNQISKNLRKGYHIELLEPDPPWIKSVTKTDLKQTEKVMETDVTQEWISRIRGLNGLIQDAKIRKVELTQQLSDVDEQLCDIYHYIEFSKLNACQGYKAAKMIKDKRIARRRIKNELQVLSIILSSNISDDIEQEVVGRIKGMDNRVYNPRSLTELFEL